MLEATPTKEDTKIRNGDLSTSGKVPLTPTMERHKVSRIIKVTKAKDEPDEAKRTLDEV